MPELPQSGVTYPGLLKSGRDTLSKKGIETAHLDAKILLEEASGLTALEQISKKDDVVEVAVIERFNEFLKRRQNFEPVHRILGYREFFGRRFDLSSETLVPRPDTETLVEVILDRAKRKIAPLKILEIGTGSGIIAITLACELSDVSVLATDISQDALLTAKLNAGCMGVSENVSFIQTNLFDKIAGEFDFIVSNPPYIPASDIEGLSEEVRMHDPILALNGGEDGLDFYRSIFANAMGYLTPEGTVVVEIGYDQAIAVSEIAGKHGLRVEGVTKDLSGNDRVVTATKN